MVSLIGFRCHFRRVCAPVYRLARTSGNASMLIGLIGYRVLKLKVYFQYRASVCRAVSTPFVRHLFIQHIVLVLAGRRLVGSCYAYLRIRLSIVANGFVYLPVVPALGVLIPVLYLVLRVLIRCKRCRVGRVRLHSALISGRVLVSVFLPLYEMVSFIGFRCHFRRACAPVYRLVRASGNASMLIGLIGYRELLFKVYLQYQASVSCDISALNIGCLRIIYVARLCRGLILFCYIRRSIRRSVTINPACCLVRICSVLLVVILYRVLRIGSWPPLGVQSSIFVNLETIIRIIRYSRTIFFCIPIDKYIAVCTFWYTIAYSYCISWIILTSIWHSPGNKTR